MNQDNLKRGGRDKEPLIMYLDIDAFFPSVEQAKFPVLRGKPVVVGSGVVASSSYEARRYGISAGTPITEAMKLCPEVIVLKGHQHTYGSFAEQIFDYCRRLTPLVEVYLDEAFCDLTGTRAAAGDLSRLGHAVKDTIARDLGITVTVGFASNRMLAKLAAGDAKPDGVAIVPAGSEETFMEKRPIGDVLGIGRKARRQLERINVRRVSDLKRFPVSYLESIFGKTAFLIHERLRGRDPQVPALLPKSVSRETSFPRATIDRDEILSVLYYLTERACRSTRSLSLVPARVTVKVRYGDGESETASGKVPDARVLDAAIFDTARILFMRMYRRCRVHLVGVVLSGLFPGNDTQMMLYDNPSTTRLADLYGTLDNIRSRYGHSSVIAGRSINLINQLERDSYGYILRTPSLTK
ncbi:MAG: DNA polymerase IV [bacterium]|jgi:DNA polymerase-4